MPFTDRVHNVTVQRRENVHHIQTNLCIHLSYLEDQRNLKIYNRNIKKKKKCAQSVKGI